VTATPTTAAASGQSGGAATVTTRPLPREELDASEESLEPPGPSPWGRRARLGLIGVAALGVVWAIIVPAAHAIRRQRRRRRAAASATARTLVAWEETKEALAGAGAPARRAETPIEFARRVAPATGVGRELLDRLAADATAATFAPEGVDDEVAARAGTVAADVGHALRARISPWRRARRALDPRPLVGAGRRE
jgi:hypothetical protein